ncbi:Na+/H+ antiporter [Hymenobacter ginsengisoli]|uniref:Na+/H+ antiporter n=1 Tax=Hymenobacter ginsengisoli TaxID=1051626 RepID=A0ABP8QQF3_9BACT|nr:MULTISPECIES: Na+/H+ antiporter [unclassified Hymenobacter]MBO2032746.1 Na+/H+ antiporter [Hymenobacter sp. BT559]
MEHLALIIFLLALLVALSAMAPRLKLPYPVLLVVAGGLLGLVPGLPAIELNPNLIFFIFLPPLLYEASYQMSWHEFVANRRPITLLAVGLVLLTTTAVAVLAHYCIPGFSWALGFVLGAIVAPPDAVAATSVTKGLGLPRRITGILEGESLVNDASALIAYRYAVAAVVSGTFGLWDASWHFLWVAGGGAAIGIAVGYVVVRIQHHLTDATLITALSLLLPFGIYLAAEHVGVSGVLAVVAMGLMMSRRSHDIYDNQTRLLKHSFWRVLGFLLNGLVFLIIGLELRTILAGLGVGTFWSTLGYGLLVSAVTIAIRMGWVFPVSYLGHWLGHLLGRSGEMTPKRNLFITSWAGMRGVVSLATALALPLVVRGGEAFPQRNTVLFITFTVILVTLLVQGLSLPWLVRRLGVQESPAQRAAEAQELRLALTRDALVYLEGRIAAAPAPDPSLLTLREVMRRQARRLHGTLAANETTDEQPPTETETQAAAAFEDLLRCRLDVTERQRQQLVHLHHNDAYSEEAVRQVELELDRFEIALDTQLATVQQPEEAAPASVVR